MFRNIRLINKIFSFIVISICIFLCKDNLVISLLFLTFSFILSLLLNTYLHLGLTLFSIACLVLKKTWDVFSWVFPCIVVLDFFFLLCSWITKEERWFLKERTTYSNAKEMKRVYRNRLKESCLEINKKMYQKVYTLMCEDKKGKLFLEKQIKNKTNEMVEEKSCMATMRFYTFYRTRNNFSLSLWSWQDFVFLFVNVLLLVVILCVI